MLKAPNWQDARSGIRPYQMYVDACDVSLGVVLEQADEAGRLRPVTFESRKLNAHELHYTVTEKECLGIVYGCNVCERYVGGTTFDVWVDHQALEWLFHKAQLKGRLMRWVVTLQAFNFQVKYKSGKKHTNADGISRYPNPPVQKGCPDEQWIEHLLMNVGIEEVKIQDLEDIKHYLTHFVWPDHVTSESLPQLKRKLKIYCMIGGRLFQRAAKGRPPRRVICDKVEKSQILKASHEGFAGEGGHRGINATVRSIVANYEWGVGNVYDDVKDHVMTCDICQKCEGKLTKEPIYMPNTSWIFHKLFVDCIGPLPRTSGGHEYIVVGVEDLTGFIEA